MENHNVYRFTMIYVNHRTKSAIFEGLAYLCAFAVAQSQGNFNGDLKRMGGILADCVSQVKGIQAGCPMVCRGLLDGYLVAHPT